MTTEIPAAVKVSGDQSVLKSPATVAPIPGKKRQTFDRSIIDGPIASAVWKIAWPSVLQNMIGGLQGIVDHALVGHYVGFTGNAAIGVSWQIFLVVIVFISSLFTGMGVLVARFAGANDHDKVDRVVYQAFLTAVALALFVLAPLGYVLSPTLLQLVHAAPEVRAAALPCLSRSHCCLPSAPPGSRRCDVTHLVGNGQKLSRPHAPRTGRTAVAFACPHTC